MVRRRLRILMVLVTLPFLAVLGRLWSIQVDLGAHIHYRLQAEHTVAVLVAPRRGRILDRNGLVLAENQALFDLRFAYRQLNPRSVVTEEISRVLSRWGSFPASGEIEARLRSLVNIDSVARRQARGDEELLLLIEKIPPPAASAIAVTLEELDGDRGNFDLRPATSVLAGERQIDDSQAQDLWVRIPAVLRMELTLHRLARTIPGVSYAELLRRALERVDGIEERVRREAQRSREAGMREPVVARKARRDRETYLTRPWPLVSGVDLDVVTAVEYHPDLYPGIDVVDGTLRHYPKGEAAGALVGYLRSVNTQPKTLERLRESHALLDDPSVRGIRSANAFAVLREGGMCYDDLLGSCGLERFYDDRLRGKYGVRIVRVDNRGKSRGVLEALPPVPGEDLVTTLDAKLQQLLYDQLETACRGPAAAGSVAVMEIPSGALLASVGFPAFDPNRLRQDKNYIGTLERSLGKQSGFLLDRPRMKPLYPGSTFKVVTAIAALEDGVDWNGPVDPRRSYPCNRTFEYTARPRHCTSRHGQMDLVDSLMVSCNSYFYHLGFWHLNPGDLHHWASHFGFGAETGVDLPPHRYAAGRLEMPTRRRSTAMCQFAIGQVFVEATPLQVLRLMGAIAGRGNSVPRPYLVQPGEPESCPPVEPSTFQSIVEGMERAARDPQGTAGKYGLRGYRLAVKTGTAQYTDKGPNFHAWIAGFAPVENPKIAFAVVLERTPKGGGEACSPLVRTLLEYFAKGDPEFRVKTDAP